MPKKCLFGLKSILYSTTFVFKLFAPRKTVIKDLRIYLMFFPESNQKNALQKSGSV